MPYSDEALEALRLFKFMMAGHLPYAGGVYDQPNRLLEMIEVVNQAYYGGKSSNHH